MQIKMINNATINIADLSKLLSLLLFSLATIDVEKAKALKMPTE